MSQKSIQLDLKQAPGFKPTFRKLMERPLNRNSLLVVGNCIWFGRKTYAHRRKVNTTRSTPCDGMARFRRRNCWGSDVADGITGSSDGLQSLSLAVDSNGKPFVSWSSTDSFSTQIYLRGNLNVANRVIYASATIPLSVVLATNTLQPGDIVVVDEASLAAPTVLKPEHSGIQIVGDGAGHTRVTGKLTIAGASNLKISGLNLAGGLDAINTTGLEIANNRIEGSGLLLNGTSNTRLINNEIVSNSIGITLRANSNTFIDSNNISGSLKGIWIASSNDQTTIRSNTLRSEGIGLHLEASLTNGEVSNNDIRAANIGVDYAGSTTMTANRIHGSSVGVRVAPGQSFHGSPTDLLTARNGKTSIRSSRMQRASSYLAQ